MQVKRETVVGLLEALDYKTASKWNVDRMLKKLREVPGEVNDDTDLDNDDLNSVLDDIVDAVEADEDIEIVLPEKVEDEPEEAEAVDLNGDDEEDQDDDDEEDQDDDDEEEVVVKKPAPKKRKASQPKLKAKRGRPKKKPAAAEGKKKGPKKKPAAAEGKKGRAKKKPAAAEGKKGPKKKPAAAEGKKKGPKKKVVEKRVLLDNNGRRQYDPSAYESRRGNRPGIIQTVIGWLEKASESKPLHRDKIVERLAKQFPERDVDGMRVTVYSQVPLRLRKVKQLEVGENDKGYWIES